jgi:uncharacterized repeat protein (TIGR01451 family)
MRCRRWAVVVLVVLLSLASGTSSLGNGEQGLAAPTLEGESLVVLRAGYGAGPLHIVPPRRLTEMGAASATWVVDWLEGGTNAWGYPCDSWPSEAKAAVQHALVIWGSETESGVPMEVEACWSPLAGNVLGIGGPAVFVRDFGVGQPGTWYPVALANALAGADLNGGSGPRSHELNVVINSAFAGWYTGLDGMVPPSQHDLVTAVLHEVCHGLGFVSSMDGQGSVGTWGLGTPPYPVIFDRYLQNGYGQALLSFPNGSIALRDQLLGQGGGVTFAGPYADAANGGGPVGIYAPSVWELGASISHLDAPYSGGPNALMTTTLWSGQAIHDPGPVTHGIMRDLGYLPPLSDLAVSSRVLGPGELEAGDAVTLTLEVGNVGLGQASSVVLTETLPPGVDYVGSAASPSLGGASPTSPSPGTWVWQLPDMTAGASGTITIWATLDVGLEEGFALWAVATVYGTEGELELDNNVARSLLGGHRAYLPVTLAN